MSTVLRRCLAAFTVLAAAAVPAARAQQVTVGGVIYGQYAYYTGDTANHFNNFDITRAYVNVIGRFAGGIGTRVTGDIYQNTDGSRSYRLKYAYATWTPEHSPLTYKFGLIHTPWVDWEESLWGYRMQGTVPMDRYGYLSSSDFGAGVDGNFSADRLNFQVGAYNGESYSKAPADQRKDVMARVSYRLMATDDGTRVGGLRVSGYAQYGKPTGGGARQRYIGMVSYRTNDYTLAAQYAATRDSASAAATVGGFNCAANTLCDGHVASVYGVLHFPQTRYAIIGRVDLGQADTNADSTKTTRFIFGASYQLSPNVRVLADYDVLWYDSAYSPTAAQYAARQQALFQVQFTF